MKRGDNGKGIKIQKKKISLVPRHLYQEMIKPTNQGGFPGARDDNGEVCISKSNMLKYWPNHVTLMRERDKLICGCETCIISDENHQSLRLFRKRLIEKEENKIQSIDH